MITREAFTAAYAARSNIAVELLLERMQVKPCACGDNLCEGWQVVPLDD